MTSGPIPNPAQTPTTRQEGTPVADADVLRTASGTCVPSTQTRIGSAVDERIRRVPRAAIDRVDTTPDRVAEDAVAESPVSVWTTAQTSPGAQRKGRYTAESTAHPAKMLPAVAAYAIGHYTAPGDLVLDPMCGIGTTLVEALHAGRRAVGVEYEPHWVEVSRANLALAHHTGVTHEGRVFHGDARRIASLLPPEYLGQAALVVTSPPYGPSTHGQVSAIPGVGVQKYHHLYGNTLDRGNLANIGHHRLLAGFTRILTGLTAFLRPGGHIAITIRPWREHAELIDLPSQILACGRAAGLIPVERCVALLGRIADDGLVARGSFFQRDFIRKQREAGLPLHLIAHEDVLILRTPLKRQSSHELGRSQRELGPRQRAVSHVETRVAAEDGPMAA